MFHSDRKKLIKIGAYLKELQKNCCFYCGKTLSQKRDVDHFIPWSQYPRDTGHNFVLAHPSCNRKKRDALAAKKHLEQWLARNEAFDAEIQSEMNTLGFHSDLNTSLKIAYWAYRQGVDINARAWLAKDQFEDIDQSYTALLIST